MKKEENQVFALIKSRYFQLDKDYDKLLAVCKTDTEKKQLRRDYIIARANFKKSVNLQFDLSDPIIKKLTEELKSIERKIEKCIKGMDTANTVISLISQSVKLASSIVVTVMSFI